MAAFLKTIALHCYISTLEADSLESRDLLPTKANVGAARLKVKTVEEVAKIRQEANKNAGGADKAKELPAQLSR